MGKVDKRKALSLVGALILGGIAITGGAAMLALTLVLIIGFLLGKYSEKLMSAVRDYRLSQKLNRVHWSQVEFEALQKENEVLKETVKNQAIYQTSNQVPYAPPRG